VASFVNNNKCWFFFGTRLKSDTSTIRPFKENSSYPKSSDGGLEKTTGKENNSSRRRPRENDWKRKQVFQTTTSRKRLEKKTSLPDDDLEKTTGKENKCERKKIKLETGSRQRESDRKCPKVRESDRPEVVDESDDDLFSINRNDCRRKSRLDSLEDFPGIG
jgi:hypothetical protein